MRKSSHCSKSKVKYTGRVFNIRQKQSGAEPELEACLVCCKGRREKSVDTRMTRPVGISVRLKSVPGGVESCKRGWYKLYIQATRMSVAKCEELLTCHLASDPTVVLDAPKSPLCTVCGMPQ